MMIKEEVVGCQSTPLISTPQGCHTKRKTPLPNPFFHENLSFSTKSNLSSAEFTPEPSKPRPRAQSLSRCFKQSQFSGPKVVGGVDEASFLSTPGYSNKTKQTYFQQCFIISKVLGEGSFGKVYKCTDKATKIDYAIKFSKGYIKEGLEEVRKHEALLPHPNCVKFYKAWQERKHLYIQMELCDESLASYIRRSKHRLIESEVWRVLQHCLMGLTHFHSNKLLHMDIKPDNIFRCVRNKTTNYKLGDFGLAITSHDLNATDIREGDSKYLAPELLNGRCDEKADIFSVGISVLELAANIELPNNGKMWHDLRQGSLPPTPGYSIALRNIISEMMKPDPLDRPSAYVLLSNPNHKYYSVLNLVKDTTNSVLSSLWSNWVKPCDSQSNSLSHDSASDLFEDMEEIPDEEEEEEDSIKIQEPQISPLLMKKIHVTPNASPSKCCAAG